MQDKSQKPQKPKRSKLPALIVAGVLALGVAVGAALVFSGVLDGTFGSAPVVVEPYILEGDISGVNVAAHGGDTTAEGFNDYFNGAVNYASKNGFNTIIYDAMPEGTVYWRDKTLEMNEVVTQDDSLFNKSFDPLALLLEKARMSGVQVWVRVNTNLTNNFTDAAYVQTLREGLKNLPQNYGIAGIVLDGLGVDTDALSSTVADIINDYSGYQARVAFTMASEQAAISMQRAVNAQFALVNVTGEDGYLDRLAELNAQGDVVLEPAVYDDSTRVIFSAVDFGGYRGAVLSSYPDDQRGESSLAILRGAAQSLEGYEKPIGYTVPTTLEVTNPSYGYGTTSNKIYIMGTADPSQPVYIDGMEIADRTESGLFGVLVDMELGENTWEITQGSETVTYLAKYHAPEGGSGGGTAPEYVYQEVEDENAAIRVTFQFVSAFWEWADTSVPNEMFYKDAVAKIYNVLYRDNVAYAYQITGGDWIYAKDAYGAPLVEEVEWSDISFTGLSLRETEGGEYIDFVGEGTPAAYVHYEEEDNSLRITMFNTSFSLNGGFSSRLVQSSNVRYEEATGETILTLYLNDIWGYQLEYVDGGTTLYLKDPVQLGANSGKPLEGVTIMLDPGHGDTDFGAWAGVVGTESSMEGPYEKDLVLSIGQATAYRLRQLGAEVIMTRDDDSLMELYDRLTYQNTAKPDMYISLHTNSVNMDSDIAVIGGTEVYYYHPYIIANSKGLAENLVNSLVNTTGFRNRHAKWSTYVVTRTTVCPSVLCEYGFLGNIYEFESMVSTEAIYNQADATVEAILATLQGRTIEWLNPDGETETGAEDEAETETQEIPPDLG